MGLRPRASGGLAPQGALTDLLRFLAERGLTLKRNKLTGWAGLVYSELVNGEEEEEQVFNGVKDNKKNDLDKLNDVTLFFYKHPLFWAKPLKELTTNKSTTMCLKYGYFACMHAYKLRAYKK